jgi:hypothetical protein
LVAESEANGDEADELGTAECSGGRQHQDQVEAFS